MPRPPRLHVPGACYHVILRGNHREALFSSLTDRDALDDIVAHAMQRFSARIHAFCWMTNHLHALLQISDQPLGKIMQCIAMRYSRYRHKSLHTSGHLFERRYKAKLVDIDAYFLVLLRYIHLNPIKARIVTDPAEYRWSSHRGFLGTCSIPWLTTEFGLSMFSHDLARARVAYREFMLLPVADDDGPEQASHPDDSRIIGTDQFVSQLSFAPYRPRSALTLLQLAESICAERHVSLELLRSPSRARAVASMRASLAVRAMELHVATLSEVARFLNRDASSLARLVARHASGNERRR